MHLGGNNLDNDFGSNPLATIIATLNNCTMVQQLFDDNFENVDTVDKGRRPKKKANVLRSGWPQGGVSPV